jgi:hypothetical protein
LKIPRIQPFCPQKGHIDRAMALTVRLLWICVESRGKGAKKPLHRLTLVAKAVPFYSST